MNQERFDKIELTYGCGYWNVCDDHACPCGSTAAVSQGFNEEVYARMAKAQEKYLEELHKEMERYEKKKACWE